VSWKALKPDTLAKGENYARPFVLAVAAAAVSVATRALSQ